MLTHTTAGGHISINAQLSEDAYKFRGQSHVVCRPDERDLSQPDTGVRFGPRSGTLWGMSGAGSASVGFDPEAIHAKYRAERDKRLVEGQADIRDLDRDQVFGHYRDDPFTPFAERPAATDEVDVVIVGGGIAGVLAGAELRGRGIERIR